MSRNEAFNSGHNHIVARLSTGPEHEKHWQLSSDDFENPTISSHAILDVPFRSSSTIQAHVAHSTPHQIDTTKKGNPVYDEAYARVELISPGQDEPFHEFNVPAGRTLRSAVVGTIKGIQEMAQGTRPVENLHPDHVREWFPWATEGGTHKLSVQFKPSDVEAHAAKLKQERGY
jgi:hypothetical protein